MFYEKPILDRVLPSKVGIVLQRSVSCQLYNKEIQRETHSATIFHTALYEKYIINGKYIVCALLIHFPLP